MVNTSDALVRPRLVGAVGLYVVVAVATLAALVVLSVVDPAAATQEAWVHAVVVGALALLLPLRVRAARRGSRRALVAVRVIAAVLLVANLVEALVPGLFPTWMRVEMVGLAALMAAVLLLSRARRA